MKTILKNLLLAAIPVIIFSNFISGEKRYFLKKDKIVNYEDSILLKKARKILNASIKKFETVKSYRAVIVSTEIINGKKRETEYILTKFMRPNSIYLKWLPGPYEGMQVSYVQYRDGKKSFRGLEKGLAGIFGDMEFKNNSLIVRTLYPHHFSPKETSLKYFVDMAQAIFTKETKKKTVKIICITTVIDKYLKRKATKIAVKLSDNPNAKFLWYHMDLYFDHVTKLPLHFKLYSFKGGLSGEYAFTNFTENIDIKSSDFDL